MVKFSDRQEQCGKVYFMTLDTLIQEARALPVEERKQLIMALVDSLTEAQYGKTHNPLEFYGVGAQLRDMDAQEHVNQLRAEWDDRP
jgi:hypothetical protein